MQASELRFVRHALKFLFVVMPGYVAGGLCVVAFCILLFPAQVAAWLWGKRVWSETFPYRPVLRLVARYEEWTDRFLGNPWHDRTPKP